MPLCFFQGCLLPCEGHPAVSVAAPDKFMVADVMGITNSVAIDVGAETPEQIYEKVISQTERSKQLSSSDK